MSISLKQALDGFVLVYVHNDKGRELARAFRRDDDYVFSGVTGTHTLAANVTDAVRLQEHWNGFSEACVQHARTQDLRLARWQQEG